MSTPTPDPTAGEGLSEVIRSVTDLWDEPLDEVHDVPPIVNAILASDWLAAHMSAAATRARAEEGERIAQAIEADLAAWNALGTPGPGRETDAQWFVNRAMQNAARIARALAPDTAGESA